MRMPLYLASNFFSEKITAYDVTWNLIAGRQVATLGFDYHVFGAIQPKDNKRVELGSDGALSDGNLMLFTCDILKMSDLSQQDGQSNVQTYLKSKGETWKVNEIGNWNYHTSGVNEYRLTKYTNIDT